jgi:hypothetical protein
VPFGVHRAAKHFHSPYCPKIYVNRSDFTKHILQCESVYGRDPGATARGPDVTSATARGPDLTNATARGPDVTRADVTRATARGPDVTCAAARDPDVTSADVTSATARDPGSACPAMRPASKRKIKCRNCSLWLNKNDEETSIKEAYIC